MSFCKHCGSQLKGTETFCYNCGAPVPGIASVQTQNHQQYRSYAPPVDNFTASAAGLPSSFFGPLGANKIFFIVTLIIWALNPLFCAFGKVEASALGGLFSDSATLYHFFGVDEGWIITVPMVISIILVIISVLLMLRPLFKGKAPRPRSLLLAKIMSILATIGFIGFVLIFISEGGKGVDTSLAFGGWMYLLINIATVIMLFMLSGKIKRTER